MIKSIITIHSALKIRIDSYLLQFIQLNHGKTSSVAGSPSAVTQLFEQTSLLSQEVT